MRIGIVINKAWNIYNFRMGLVKDLLSKGHQVVAIAPDDIYSSYLVSEGCEFIDVKMDNKGANPLTDMKLAYKLYQAYKAAKLDAVLHYTVKPNIYGTVAAKLLGIKIINNVTGLGTIFLRPNKLSSKVAIQLYKFAFKFPETVFFQNGDDRALFVDKNIVKSKITVLLPGSGVDLEKFKPAPFKRNERFTFLLIARLLFDKGIMEYAEAIRILRAEGINAKFQILGNIETDAGLGVTLKTVKAWEEEGLIEYLGSVKDVRPVIEEADCVLLPSYREGTPRTLLEAGALAKPLIATDVPGCRETIIDGLNGFLCKVKDAVDLAAKMKAMILLSNEKLQEMGNNSRLYIEERFDQNIVIDKYYDALHLSRETLVKEGAKKMINTYL